MLSLLYAAVFFLLALSLGRALLSSFRFTPLKSVVFSAAAGYAVFSFLFFSLAALRALSSQNIIIVVAAAAVLLAHRIKDDIIFLLAIFRRGIEAMRQAAAEKIGLSILVLLGLMLVVQAIAVFAPPSSNPRGPLDWDSLVYHFSVAKSYAQNQGFVFLPSIPHSNWPVAMEMLYAAAMAVDSVILAKLFAFSLGPLLLACIYAFSREHLSKEASFFAVAVFSSIPLLQAFLGTGYVDVALTLFELLAYWSLLEWRRGEGERYLALAAVMTGFAAATKNIGGFFALAMAILTMAFLLSKRKMPWQAIKHTTVFVVIAGLLASPYYLKTFYYTGNPTWPIYYPIYRSLGINEDAGARYFTGTLAETSAESGFGRGIEWLPLIPVTATLFGQKFNGIISPLFLAVLPLVLLLRKRKWPDFAKPALALSAMLVMAWFFTYQEARFLFPPLALLSPVVGYAYQEFRGDKTLGKHLKAALVIVLVATAAFAVYYKSAAIPAALGLESHAAYLLRTQSNYGTLKWANANLPSDSKIFFFRDIQGFYSDRQYYYFIAIDFTAYTSSDAMRTELKRLGITHVLVNENNGLAAGRHGEAQRALMAELLKNRGSLLYSYNRVFLYKLD